ncbi:uracil-DNA glycosylase [Aurantiacibacter spongiae]|uniref:Uracil-DNA glycosylase n=1 Tax=Aurantiacibacter spongiae TaxID=2488860 RepID=A0A3N5CR12_9SPHN|nr:uracil-DNA glycosylase [Aurantiacibacter spongiae]RPF71543.1 uracil-DNA glycosylase [Aurantiacibacter spongiae]
MIAPPASWSAILDPVLGTAGARALDRWLMDEEAAGRLVFPPARQRFRALGLTPPDAVKVVILGQDPYHGAGQAHGLAFSVPAGIRPPPSLRNILRELEDDLGVPAPESGDLTAWARRGVLLLNTALSVEEGRAGSHARRGWAPITDAILRAVARRDAPTVFVAWGSHAQTRARAIPDLVEDGPHLLIESPHPSPLSAYRGFFGSRPFSRANDFLIANGREAVEWRLDPDHAS